MPAVNCLLGKGYRVVLGAHVFAQYYQFAGTDKQRWEDLQIALDDPECDVIMCSRGGYGTVRFLGKLDFSEFKKHPKWLVGYSDITMLHIQINKLGIASIHGTMPPFFLDENGVENNNLESLLKVLSGNDVFQSFESSYKNKVGEAKSEIVGGNLSIICSLLGTKYEIESKGKILFLEEVDEYLYHIDRMMHQLKFAGKLELLAGLVLGDFTEMKDNESPFGKTVHEIILDSVSEYNYPVCFGFPAGHDKKNLALPFGKSVEMSVSKEKATLKTEKW